jgi:hypothetical protein
LVVVGGSTEGGTTGTQINPNPLSYKAVYGQPAPDPEHEEYLGMQKPLYYVDHQLTGTNSSDDTALMNFVSGRLIQNLFHARKTYTFEAPLILITDPDDAKQRRPRPLRIADEIVIYDRNANPFPAVVLNCNPQIHKDVAQMAHYEVIFPPQTAADIEL